MLCHFLGRSEIWVILLLRRQSLGEPFGEFNLMKQWLVTSSNNSEELNLVLGVLKNTYLIFTTLGY